MSCILPSDWEPLSQPIELSWPSTSSFFLWLILILCNDCHQLVAQLRVDYSHEKGTTGLGFWFISVSQVSHSYIMFLKSRFIFQMLYSNIRDEGNKAGGSERLYVNSEWRFSGNLLLARYPFCCMQLLNMMPLNQFKLGLHDLILSVKQQILSFNNGYMWKAVCNIMD